MKTHQEIRDADNELIRSKEALTGIIAKRKLADKKAQDLTKSGKSPHFVQPVKEAIEG